MVMRLRYPAPDGWEAAKCRNVPVHRDYDPFFQEDEDEKSEALAFCNGEEDGQICAVRHECLLFALTNNCKDGVWGGTSEVTRKAIRKHWQPNKNGKPRDEWQWMNEKDALKGLSREEILVELDVEE